MGPWFSRAANNAVDGFNISPSQFSKRLLSELKILTTSADVQSYFRYESSGQHEGKFCIIGYLLPQSEPYRNGAFKVRIILPNGFPFESPKLQLLTPIYHSTVNEDMSKPEFCTKCCRPYFDYRPTSHISEFLKYYLDIIDGSGAGCDNNPEARRLYHADNARYQANALEMVTRYAYPRQTNT
jgi:ubiquitin-conjugating enzyme E2 D/E